MLEEIVIENLGVIRRAHLPLGAGLTALTGETGAGKTMVLTGLSLLMGGKADASRVRVGADGAVVEGRVAVTPDSAVRGIVADAGGAIDDDGSLIVLRTVAAQGRSRAHLGGRSVPQALLGQVAAEFVTVHGQSDQLRLRSRSRQRQALDEYLGSAHLELLSQYRRTWSDLVDLRARMGELEGQLEERAREAELLRLGLAEVDRIEPQHAEDVELGAEIARLSNTEDLRLAVTVVHSAVSGDEDVAAAVPTAVGLVEEAKRELEAAVAHDESLSGLLDQVSEIGYVLADVGSQASSYLASLSADPQRLESAQQRMAELSSLTRSYGGSVDAVLEWASSAGLRLLELEGSDDLLEQMRAEERALEAELEALSDRLSATRGAGAGDLSRVVTQELEGLAMADAKFLVEVTPDPAGNGPWGRDEVSMLLAPHPGAPPTPLGRGASGGELSRVMLAIEVALAQNAGPGKLRTFVFDEVDAGVGGRAAFEVGRRLAELARSAQVIVVTHLAQVAAFADQQIVVSKEANDVVTESDVRVVTGEDRVAELARMLSGQQDLASARQHASELLEAAVMG